MGRRRIFFGMRVLFVKCQTISKMKCSATILKLFFPNNNNNKQAQIEPLVSLIRAVVSDSELSRIYSQSLNFNDEPFFLYSLCLSFTLSNVFHSYCVIVVVFVILFFLMLSHLVFFVIYRILQAYLRTQCVFTVELPFSFFHSMLLLF